jgi:hypothetical protein
MTVIIALGGADTDGRTDGFDVITKNKIRVTILRLLTGSFWKTAKELGVLFRKAGISTKLHGVVFYNTEIRHVI